MTALLKTAVGALEALKGEQITTIDVSGLTTITDHMVICTGSSSRHVQSLAQRVVDDCRAAGAKARGLEGMERGEWVLVDLGDVVVHVMQAQMRALYALEKLWDLPEVPPASAPDAAAPSGDAEDETGSGSQDSRGRRKPAGTGAALPSPGRSATGRRE